VVGAEAQGWKDVTAAKETDDERNAHCNHGVSLNYVSAPTSVQRKRPPAKVAFFIVFVGGRYKDRTCDTCRVKAVLYR
jgi:hypothetical protein